MWVAFNYYKKNEKVVISNLVNQGFEFFIPKINLKVRDAIKTDNLFPGYGFVKFNESIYSLNFTKGVNKVVRFGSAYGLLKDGQINEIKKLIDESFASPIIIRKPIDSQVEILNGPLKGISGKLISYTAKDRVVILYHLLGRNLTLEIQERNLAAI